MQVVAVEILTTLALVVQVEMVEAELAEKLVLIPQHLQLQILAAAEVGLLVTLPTIVVEQAVLELSSSDTLQH